MKKLNVSVIIPSYNSQLTIKKCLRGLAKQTLKPLEIIIVDDGSTDDTKNVISNFQLLEQKHKGPGAARNLGVRHAKGEIIAFIDSDCIPPKNWLKNMVVAFSDPEVGAVGGGYNGGINSGFWQRFSCEELRYRRQKRSGSVTTLVSNNMACRKKSFRQAKGFSEKYPVCEDMLLSYKISLKHKILWLKNNGVKHHFKNSFIEFLRHQYRFGKESSFFFLDNPQLLLADHHQSKLLHLSIMISFLAIASYFLSGFFLIFRFFALSLTFFHLILYWKFLTYLNKKGFPPVYLLRAYLVSFVRDFVSVVSFSDGFLLYIRKK